MEKFEEYLVRRIDKIKIYRACLNTQAMLKLKQ